MNKNIAFVIPHQTDVTKDIEVPLGILSLATVIKQKGYNPLIYDLTLKTIDELKLINELKKNKVKIMGISFGTANRFDAFELCANIKASIPNIIIIAGGWHVNTSPIDTIKNIKDIDIVALNEGENLLPELLNVINGGIKIKKLEKVKGIVFRKNGKPHHTGQREFVKDLDTIPWVDRSLVNMEDYKQHLPYDNDTPSTSMITSRGCPYACIYCSTAKHWGHMTRFRTIKDVVDEVEHIVKTYNIRGIDFRDDTFTLRKDRVVEFCNELKRRKLDIKWCCETRANTIDEDTVKLMKETGCYYMAMAIESANDKTIKIIKKGITIKQATEVVKMMHRNGILLKTFFMFGLPGEGKEEIKNTCFMIRDFQNKYKVRPIYSITTVYPGTQLEIMAKQQGIIPEDFTWSKPIKQPKQKYNLYFGSQTPLYQESHMLYERLAKLIRKYFITYYLFHPIYFVKNMWEYKREVLAWIK